MEFFPQVNAQKLAALENVVRTGQLNIPVRKVRTALKVQRIRHICPTSRKLLGTEVITEEKPNFYVGKFFKPEEQEPAWTNNYQRVEFETHDGFIKDAIIRVA